MANRLSVTLRTLIALSILLFVNMACSFPVNLGLNDPTTTPSLTPSVTSTITPTPTPFPTATPTPIPAARVELGDLNIFYGDWDSALQEYRAAFQSIDDAEVQSAALIGEGRVYYLEEDLPRALRTLRQVIDTHPESPHLSLAYYFLAQVYIALDRFQEAEDAYQGYLNLRPSVIDSYIHEWRANAFFEAGDVASALRALEDAVASPRAGDRTNIESRLGQAYALNGDYQTAIITYQDIFNRTSNDFTRAQMLLLLGQAYLASGQQEMGYTSYLQAVENYPVAFDSFTALVELVNAGYPVSELDRGLVDYYANQHGVALSAFERYLSSNPQNPEGEATARYFRGLSLRTAGNSLAAIAEWDAVIQNYPGTSYWDDAWEQKGYTQWAFLDQYPEAVQTFLDFVTAMPEHARASQFLDFAGRVAERNGRFDQAAAIWDRISVDYPSSEQVYRSSFLSGISYYRLTLYESALVTFQRALSQAAQPQDKAAAMLWIGKIQQKLGNDTEAAKIWLQAAGIDPTGYYSERAGDLLLGRKPFSTPESFDFSYDLSAERSAAEDWIRTTFSLPEGTPLNGLGALASDERVIRGEELWNLGLYNEARLEFESLRQEVANDGVNSYRLGTYLIDHGLYRSGITAIRQVLNLAGLDNAGTFTAPKYFNRLRFGAYFSSMIIPAAQQHDFHPLFLFSVARQESLFEGFVRSSAGARGVMQIIPSTGSSIASRIGWPPDYKDDDLYRPYVSIVLGSEYLARQRDAFGEDLYAALAAYNGGPGNASIWKSLSHDDPDLFLEIVRFEETRRYIRSIYEIFTIYYKLYDRSP